MSIVGIIVLILVICFLFARGPGEPYFAPGISLSGILLILLVLWALGYIGGPSHIRWR